MRKSLEHSPHWIEHRSDMTQEEGCYQEVRFQYSFAVSRGWPMEPGVLDPGRRGDAVGQAILQNMKAEKQRNWKVDDTLVSSVLMLSFDLALTVITGRTDPAECQAMGLVLLGEARTLSRLHDLDCQMTSVAIRRTTQVTTMAWFHGAEGWAQASKDASPLLGDAIRAGRDRLHVSLDHAAKLCGVARRTILRLEHGNDGISLGNAGRIAESLGMEIVAQRKRAP